MARWRTSSFTSSGADCVELSGAGRIRDSKNPAGPILRADLAALVKAVKTGRVRT
jgi:hypothetical protein